MYNKIIFFACCAALVMQAYQVFSEDPGNPSSIRWQTNYDQAFQQAKASSKPLVLLFTGSDWCSWCIKLEQEALNTPAFAAAADDKFVFVKIDFPLYSAQDPNLKVYNKQLQQKFDVRSFPTVIVFDPQNNQQIGTTGYRPGGGKQYADYLIKMLNDYKSYKQKMGALSNDKFSGKDLKQLYEKAKELHCSQDANKIVKLGINSDASLFFLTERYQGLASEGKVHSEEACSIRKQLLAADPDNQLQLPYQVAVIEFEANCEELEKESYNPELAVAPLVAYLEKFGEHDKDHLWRLQMIISQVFLDCNQLASALKYAQASLDSAPASVQPEITRAILNIRSQIHSSLTTN